MSEEIEEVEEIRFGLEVHAEADTRPGTPEEIEASNRRVALVEALGSKVLDPDPPAEDKTICRTCFSWRARIDPPGTYGWFADCALNCSHTCHLVVDPSVKRGSKGGRVQKLGRPAS